MFMLTYIMMFCNEFDSIFHIKVFLGLLLELKKSKIFESKAVLAILFHKVEECYNFY